ncbi:hypothetical protein ACFFJT_10115 [Dyella flava]|uniref:Uncharacterized protein n=1 Tax=Dyella flava TaxID=1920170 RepID=A0ABS2K4S3_9GAMM|nr:hypothetical protein [Dyella flava]MBM7125303.1 hypothetical protein [Dyella flava]GLQ50650.1 hypothetical protein GCM10010872_20990 [Dyella flava]
MNYVIDITYAAAAGWLFVVGGILINMLAGLKRVTTSSITSNPEGAEGANKS